MKRAALGLAFLVAMVGCAPDEPQQPAAQSAPAPQVAQTRAPYAAPAPAPPAQPQGGGGDNLIIGPPAAGMTPVNPSVDLGDEGGGVGQAAKDKARSVAGGPMGPSQEEQDAAANPG